MTSLSRTQVIATWMVLLALLTGCAGSDDEAARPPAPAVTSDPGPVHVHGLGVNPKDGALFIASHTGLFRVARGQRQATRVANRFQDTMGFTVTGPDRFLGSGHPDGRDRLPPFLGLLRSTDAGNTWTPVSLLGAWDFHVLEAAGRRVYGFGSQFKTRRSGLRVSNDGGTTWSARAAPEPLLSLAIDPADADRVLATADGGLYVSTDAGRRWRSLTAQSGLVAWAPGGRAYLATLDGRISRSTDAGARWRQAGDTRGPPAAFEAAGDDLYVALHDGTVKRSTDGGRSWAVRSRAGGAAGR